MEGAYPDIYIIAFEVASFKEIVSTADGEQSVHHQRAFSRANRAAWATPSIMAGSQVLGMEGTRRADGALGRWGAGLNPVNPSL